jgi:pyrimidine-nucleoside phosphorylase
VIDDPHRLPQARLHADVLSPSAGYISATNCQQFGIALAILGGGREKKEDAIDHAVGLKFHKRIGDRVEKGEPLATISYNADTRLAEAKALIAENYFVSPEAPREKRPLIRRILGA